MRKEGALAQAKSFFAAAIARQKNGHIDEAHYLAGQCLLFLEPLETAEETAAGEVLRVEGHTVCLPDFLHTETARQRFRAVGIAV